MLNRASLVVQMVKKKKSAGNAGDRGLIPGWERFPGKWNGTPLQYSCRESHGQSHAEFSQGESHGQRGLAGYSHGVAKRQTWVNNDTHVERLDVMLAFSWKTFRNIPWPLLFTAAAWVWIISVTFIGSSPAAVRGRSVSELHATLLEGGQQRGRETQRPLEALGLNGAADPAAGLWAIP